MSCHLRSHRSYLWFGLVSLVATQLLPGKDKERQKPAEPYALLFGTCFDGRGFSLPGASVVVELASEPLGKMKKKKWEMISSPRGEFTVRLPAGHHTFRVAAAKGGFRPAEKTVSFEADERQDMALRLEAESGKK